MASPPEGDGRSTVEILGDERPLVRERWQTLSRRTRVTVAATTCAVVLGGVLAYVVAHRPPPPPPDPAAATTVRITDVQMPPRLSPDFGITLRVAAASRVTFVGMAEGYGNLFLYELPVPGAVLLPGHARTLHVRLDVYCQTPHPRRGTPVLFVIVRNTRGEGRAPVMPTRAQFAGITRAVNQVCTH
jgi:hypothetical protein